MTTKQIPIAQATASELADFATVQLQIDGVNYRHGAAAILAKMQTVGYTKDFIEVEAADAVDPNARVATQAVPAEQRKYITILIPTQEGAGGSDPVPVSLNGKAMLIERGKPQRIPAEYISCLKDAVKMHYDPAPNGGMMPARAVLTYPYTILNDAA